MGIWHFFIAHLQVIIEGLTLIALVWYATETRLLRKEDQQFHRLERRIDFYFFIKRHEEPSKTDLIRFSEYPKPRQADAVATVANLGKPSLLLQALLIRSRQGIEKEYPLVPVTLPLGTSIEFIVADLIVRFLHETAVLNGSTPPDRRSWTGELEIALKFYARGIIRVSEYQRYAIGINFDAVQTIHLIKDDENSARLVRSALARG